MAKKNHELGKSALDDELAGITEHELDVLLNDLSSPWVDDFDALSESQREVFRYGLAWAALYMRSERVGLNDPVQRALAAEVKFRRNRIFASESDDDEFWAEWDGVFVDRDELS